MTLADTIASRDVEIARLRALLQKQAGEPKMAEGASQEIAPEFEEGDLSE